MTVGKWGIETQINTNTALNQQNTELIALADGGFAVTWNDQDAAQDGNFGSTKLRIFNADGTARTGEILVNTTTANNQFPTDIIQLPNGQIWVVFADESGASDDIRLRRFGADGTPIEGTDILLVDAALVQAFAKLTVLDNGVPLLVTRNGSDISGQQLLTATGVPTGPQIDIGDVASSTTPDVAAMTNGGFAAVFKDGSGASATIRIRFFDSTMTATGASSVVSDLAANHFNPFIERLSNGNLLVVWLDNAVRPTDAEPSSVRAQLYSPTGAAIGGNFQVNSDPTGTQTSPEIAAPVGL
jgi:hypothetical protein